MSSAALKKGVEEPWTFERVVRFIDLFSYRDITLKSDTELAIVAFRNRVAAICKAEVTTEDAVKGDKGSNGLIENVIMLLRGIIRTVKCHIESRMQEPLNDDSPFMPWLVEHSGYLVQVSKRVVTGRHTVRREGAGKTHHHRSDDKDELQISIRNLAWNAKQQCSVFHRECRRCIQSS